MGYHSNEASTRKMIVDSCGFINDRTRLEIGFRLVLADMGVSASDQDVIVKCSRAGHFKDMKVFLSEVMKEFNEGKTEK